MAYCTVEDMRRILPEKVTIGDQNIGTPTPGRASTKRSNITPDEARHYIEYATQYVDSRLRPFYLCPLRRIKSFETELSGTVSPGSSVSASVRDSGSFMIGQLCRLQNSNSYETTVVESVPDIQTVVLTIVTGTYAPDDSIISVIEYPDPIPLIVARMASSYLLDRLFTAEQSPDVSNYGKTQRNLARDAVDDILSGEILLFGQEHTGRRFVRGSLFDAYKSPAEIQKGQQKE